MAIDNLYWFEMRKISLSFFPHFCSLHTREIQEYFSFSIYKVVRGNEDQVRPTVRYFIPWVGEALALFSLASHSAGIYSKALL